MVKVLVKDIPVLENQCTKESLYDKFDLFWKAIGF